MKKIIIPVLAMLVWQSCFVSDKKEVKKDAEGKPMEVNVYSHRHYDVDKEIFAAFEKETGIKVNVIEDDADKLMVRLENEGENSPCDIFMTADAGRLVKAKEKGLLQSVNSETLNNVIPSNLRDTDGQWYGLTVRARVIVYSKERVKPEELTTYEDLANPKWKGKLLIRSSDNVYNQSLVAALIAELGYEKTLEWAKGVVANLAREPKGGDRDQMLEIAAGTGDIAVVNTYYIGKLLNSEVADEVKAGEGIGVFFPNQNDRGTHINVSGAGIAKNSPNKENAVKLLEYLVNNESQQKFASGNHEYPVVNGVEYSDLLKSWGEFKRDSLPLSELGKHAEEALKLVGEAGWK
ncbi:MAG: Fe(3+) ABC transporter substrate-binding protein [Bacteroidota bacterium]